MPRVENLTAKQKAFIAEYLGEKNATKAAIKAGYSKKTAPFIGAENLKKPQIKTVIDKKLEESNQRVIVTREYVLNSLKEIADACKVKYKNGVGDSTGANRALELIGKTMAMFSDKVIVADIDKLLDLVDMKSNEQS